jgi:hypothetical protein
VTGLIFESLTAVALKQHGGATHLARALHSVYDELAAEYPAEIEAFGPRPGLSIDPEDDEFARALVPLFEQLPVASQLNRYGGLRSR